MHEELRSESRHRSILAIGLLAGLCCSCRVARADQEPAVPSAHPRLYFTAADLPRLRALRREGTHARIWKNIEDSAAWCLIRTPRKDWIAPVSPDPIYENLYDRFYAIMADLAITEHLAFAYALSGEPRYGDATRDWVLASCRAWKREAEDEPNGSKAYAVCRLLKGLAVGYDLAFDRFTEDQRQEVRATLIEIGQKYFTGYFSTPAIAGPDFHTHHAVVEWASFGVMALALLNETPQAQAWLDATIKKFEDHLLPSGLAPDGAQVEGATFWASTMHYRLFFMDPLRRVAGRDLFATHGQFLNADLALASIAARKQPGYDQDHANVVLEPSYGQLDYYSPVLACLARHQRRGIYQHLALWDATMGQIQKTRYVTPHGEPLLFELGGYAFLWYDETVRPNTDASLIYHFPSVDEAYLRTSWEADDLVVGVRKGEVVVHVGGLPILIEPMAARDPLGMKVKSVEDHGEIAAIRCDSENGQQSLQILLDRAQRRLTIRRQAGEWSWWCHGKPTQQGNTLQWPTGVKLEVTSGEPINMEPQGYAPRLATGFLKLELVDPAPMKFSRITIGSTGPMPIVTQISMPK